MRVEDESAVGVETVAQPPAPGCQANNANGGGKIRDRPAHVLDHNENVKGDLYPARETEGDVVLGVQMPVIPRAG